MLNIYIYVIWHKYVRLKERKHDYVPYIFIYGYLYTYETEGKTTLTCCQVVDEKKCTTKRMVETL